MAFLYLHGLFTVWPRVDRAALQCGSGIPAVADPVHLSAGESG